MVDFDFYEEVADFEVQHHALDSWQLQRKLERSTLITEQVALCNLLSCADFGVWETDLNCLNAMKSAMDSLWPYMRHTVKPLKDAAWEAWQEIDEQYGNLKAELENEQALKWFARR